MKISKADFRKCLAAFFSMASFIYMGLITFCSIPKDNMNNANVILGFLLGTTLAAIISYYFGGTEEKEPNKPETDNPPANKEPKNDKVIE